MNERGRPVAKESRVARVARTTKETDVAVELAVDGVGTTAIDTGVPFFDHMLDAFGRHGLFDLTVRAKGDIEVDAHHTVEDCGIVLGQAFAQAMGDKRGINRFASRVIAMDEALVLVAMDISGRGQLHWDASVPAGMCGIFDNSLAKEFMIAFASNAGLTLHVRQLAGENAHHIIEAVFKATGRVLCEALSVNPRVADQLPTTKGAL